MIVAACTYQRAVAARRPRCEEIIKAHNFLEPHTRPVSMVVLSCKRPVELERLLKSLVRMDSEDDQLMDTTFVDNGSGADIMEALRYGRYTFDQCIWNRRNFGMGPAINAALQSVSGEFVLFIEDDLVYDFDRPFLQPCLDIFREFPEVGIIKLKNKPGWDTMYPWRRVGPTQTTTTGVRFQPWLPSPWWYGGKHNVWSLGPVLFRWASWSENGPLPVRQGRGQAQAAEDEYAKTYNTKWLAAWPLDYRPFKQPETKESPGYNDEV